jgi:class 3 adenylate cyclase
MPRILIVDDEEANREALKLAIADVNPDWTVYTAQNENEGREIIAQQLEQGERIDVVLTDLVMANEQSGISMAQEARKLDPLVMTTLFTAKEKAVDRISALESGVFNIVQKNMIGTSAVREILTATRAALRYREWSQRINFLRRYFDPRMFEMIESKPALLAMQARIVTIVFWDVRGFSKLCEILKAHPTLISGFLQEYCAVAAKNVFDHNGLLDKFIGDGVMALFGVLDCKNDEGRSDAVSAVKAAIELRVRFEQLTKSWIPRWKLYTPHSIEIGLGCGIHTGEVLAGNVGTDFRDQFTALGPNVNFASRIENRSTSGQILISQSTAERVRCDFQLEPAGEINDIKNIVGRFSLFQV